MVDFFGSSSEQEQDTESEGFSGATQTEIGGKKSKGAILDRKTLRRLRRLTKGGGKTFKRGQRAARKDLRFAERTKRRAAGLEGELESENAAIVEAATARNEERLAQSQGQLATQTGSTLNSLVQANLQQNAIQLDTELAGLEGQLNLAASEQGTAALQGALGGSIASTAAAQNPLLGVAGLLKGATQETASSEFSIQDIIKAFKQESETEGSGGSTPSGVDIIGGFL